MTIEAMTRGVGAREASKLVAAHLEVERDRPRSADRTFYDTFDGRLHAADLALTHEEGNRRDPQSTPSLGKGVRRDSASVPNLRKGVRRDSASVPNPSGAGAGAGRLVLADRAGRPRAAADHPAPPKRLFASELPAGFLRDLLEPVVKGRALMPSARLRSCLHPLRVLDDEGKTVVRLVLEDASVAEPPRARESAARSRGSSAFPRRPSRCRTRP